MSRANPLKTVSSADSRLADDALTARLRSCRPELPPTDLRDRCLPSGALDQNTLTLALERRHRPGKEHRMRHRILAGGGGIAAAAAVLLAILYAWPGGAGGMNAAALAVQNALDQLGDFDTVRITSSWDTGPGTPVQTSLELLVSRALGFRTDYAHGGNLDGGPGVSGYSARRQVRWEHAADENVIRETSYRDPILLDTLFKRCRIDQNVEALRVMAQNTSAEFKDDEVLEDGRRVRRISARDHNRRPLVVVIDPATSRLLRSEAWTDEPAGGQCLRGVVRFEYPAPERIDPNLFEPPQIDSAKRVQTPVDSAARVQCMVNVRSLCTMVQLYASEHDGALPRTLEEMTRYAPDGDLSRCTTCDNPNGDPFPIAFRLPELNLQHVNQLTPEMVLFECVLPDAVIRGFGDSHAEVAEK